MIVIDGSSPTPIAPLFSPFWSSNIPPSWCLHCGAGGPLCAGLLLAGSSAHQVTLCFGDNVLRAAHLVWNMWGYGIPCGSTLEACISHAGSTLLPSSAFCERFSSHEMTWHEIKFTPMWRTISVCCVALHWHNGLANSAEMTGPQQYATFGLPLSWRGVQLMVQTTGHWDTSSSLNFQRQHERVLKKRTYRMQICHFICLKWTSSSLWVSAEKDFSLWNMAGNGSTL